MISRCELKNKHAKIQSARKNEIVRGCDYVLRRLDNERSCPMGYSVPRKIFAGDTISHRTLALIV